MRDTGEDIKWRKILAIETSNQLKIIYDNKKLTPKTKIKAFRSYFRAYFPLQLQNLNNNTFSSCKNHQCIPAETFENLCTKRKMAKYRQKWERIQKNRRHRMGQHHSKTNIEMVWESNQSRWINTSVEGVYLRQHPIPATSPQTNVNLVEHYQIRLL